MRYLDDEAVNLVGRLPTGQTVVIEVYEIATGQAVSVVTANCIEIGTTGLFKWPRSNFVTPPIVYTEYVYTMIDLLNNRYDGKFVVSPLPAKMLTLAKWLGLR